MERFHNSPQPGDIIIYSQDGKPLGITKIVGIPNDSYLSDLLENESIVAKDKIPALVEELLEKYEAGDNYSNISELILATRIIEMMPEQMNAAPEQVVSLQKYTAQTVMDSPVESRFNDGINEEVINSAMDSPVMCRSLIQNALANLFTDNFTSMHDYIINRAVDLEILVKTQDDNSTTFTLHF